MSTKYKKVEMPELVKFVKEGDSVEGTYLGMKQSEQHGDSYLVTFRDMKGKKKACYVNNQGKDLFNESKIKENQTFKLTFESMKDNADKSQQYRFFDLGVAE